MRAFLWIWICLLPSLCIAADFSLQSTSFQPNNKIPTRFTCDGSNTSPQLSWSKAPANTKSYALTLNSPDWAANYVYLWVLYNIPTSITSLPEGASNNLSPGIVVGSNFYRLNHYSGPCPPDSANHHYVFTVYALDVASLDLDEDADIKEVLAAFRPHILAQATLVTTYNH